MTLGTGIEKISWELLNVLIAAVCSRIDQGGEFHTRDIAEELRRNGIQVEDPKPAKKH